MSSDESLQRSTASQLESRVSQVLCEDIGMEPTEYNQKFVERMNRNTPYNTQDLRAFWSAFWGEYGPKFQRSSDEQRCAAFIAWLAKRKQLTDLADDDSLSSYAQWIAGEQTDDNSSSDGESVTHVLSDHQFHTLLDGDSKTLNCGSCTIIKPLPLGGGWGEMYLGWHGVRNVPVIIKVLKRLDAAQYDETEHGQRALTMRTVDKWHMYRSTFFTGCRVAQRLHERSGGDSSTVAVYDFGNDAHHGFYYAMEYLADAENLQQIIDRDRHLPPRRIMSALDGVSLMEAVEPLSDVADGNEEGAPESELRFFTEKKLCQLINDIASAMTMHPARGMVHRDIKPANIMKEKGKRGRFKLIDHDYDHIPEGHPLESDLDEFKYDGDQLILHRYPSNHFMGTKDFIAPELLATRNMPPEERNHCSFATDIYALGKTVLRAMEPPPSVEVEYEERDSQGKWNSSVWRGEGDEREQFMESLEMDDAGDDDDYPPYLDVFPLLKPIVLKMIAHDPEDRYQSWDDLLDDLRKRCPQWCKYSPRNYEAQVAKDVKSAGRRAFLAAVAEIGLLAYVISALQDDASEDQTVVDVPPEPPTPTPRIPETETRECDVTLKSYHATDNTLPFASRRIVSFQDVGTHSTRFAANLVDSAVAGVTLAQGTPSYLNINFSSKAYSSFRFEDEGGNGMHIVHMPLKRAEASRLASAQNGLGCLLQKEIASVFENTSQSDDAVVSDATSIAIGKTVIVCFRNLGYLVLDQGVDGDAEQHFDDEGKKYGKGVVYRCATREQLDAYCAEKEDPVDTSILDRLSDLPITDVYVRRERGDPPPKDSTNWRRKSLEGRVLEARRQDMQKRVPHLFDGYVPRLIDEDEGDNGVDPEPSKSSSNVLRRSLLDQGKWMAEFRGEMMRSVS